MAYTPTTWSAGDTITSAKLNKIEQGIVNAGESAGVFMVDILHEEVSSGTRYYTSKTYNEIKEAFLSGKTVIVREEEGGTAIS